MIKRANISNTNPQAEMRIAPYALLILLLCAFFQFYKYVLQTYPSVITHELMNDFDLTGAGLGNLAATFYYSFLVTQLFVGVLLDKFSTRIISSCAIFLCALGVFLFAYSNTALEACLSRALIGVGVAFTTVSFMKLASVWFAPKYYPFISSLVATATMLGVVFGQMPLAKVIAYMGWRHCLSAMGIFGFVLALFFLIYVRDRPKTSMGFDDVKVKYAWKDVLIVIKNPQNWMLMLYGGLVFSPLAVFCGLWGTPFLQEAYNINKEQSALLVSIAFIGFGIGSPVIGILSSWIGNMRAVMISSTVLSCSALCIVLYIPYQLPMYILALLLFIFGFCIGTYMLVFSAGRAINPPHLTATVMAMINTGDVLTGAAEPLIGRLLDFSWDGKIVNGVHHFTVANYHFALSLLPAYLICSTLLLFAIKSQVRQEQRVVTMATVGSA